jgi:hypothetical protein
MAGTRRGEGEAGADKSGAARNEQPHYWFPTIDPPSLDEQCDPVGYGRCMAD